MCELALRVRLQVLLVSASAEHRLVSKHYEVRTVQYSVTLHYTTDCFTNQCNIQTAAVTCTPLQLTETFTVTAEDAVMLGAA
jgi:hypothetical protein